MSKRVTEAASLELAFLAGLDSIHAGVDTSEIGEIQNWSRAVRGKLYGAVVKDASELSKLRNGLPSTLGDSNAANEQYSEMAIPQLISVCTSESNEGAWVEFVRRFLPVITRSVTRALHQSGKFSHELVDDLSQEVLLKLFRDNFRLLRAVGTVRENAFLGFLKVVAANTAQDHFRRAFSSKLGGGQGLKVHHVFSAPESSHGVFSELEKKTRIEEIEAVLQTRAQKPNFERDYKVFWLYYRNGLTAKEIAALPGIKLTVKGIKNILLRLTRQIKDALNA